MIKLSRKIITSFCLLGATYAGAQSTFYIEGLGRAQVANDQLKGDVLLSDSIAFDGKPGKQIDRKNTGGYTLLDLGINIERQNKFFLNTILRGRNNFGLFWGEGTSFEFRKITMGGLIGSGMRYEMGDIYVEMTPYTVFMPEAEYHKYESSAFGMRRGIQEYENFINGNARFLQGLKTDGTLLFTKGIYKLKYAGFASRTSKILQTGEPDVIMTGINALADQGTYGTFGVNLVGLFDVPVSTNTERLKSSTLTFNLNPKYKVNDKLTLGLVTEFGGSNYTSIYSGLQPKNIAFSGFFYDLNAKAQMKELKTTVQVGYKNVDNSFRAPGAQSRRVDDLLGAQVFPKNALDTAGNKLVRDIMLFDRFTQENMYTQKVSYKLNQFNPAFNNVNPYGDATPNRKGFVASIIRGTQNDVLSFDAKIQLLSESVADFTASGNVRKFTALQSGLSINISKLAGIENKDINIGGGYQFENTQRSGNANVDLKSSIIDIAASAELLKNVDFLFGFKNYSVKGKEQLYRMDSLNYTRIFIGEIEGSRLKLGENFYDSRESIITLGARYRFSDKNALTLSYSSTGYTRQERENEDEGDFKWNQLFVNYSMKF
jgi:hypothetical protein